MSATIAKTANILNEPGFEYRLCLWGDLIYGTPEQLRRIEIGLDVHFPEQDDGRWKRKCIDPRGFEVELSTAYSGDGRFCASISFPGRDYCWNVVEAKPFAFGVELREETHGDVYVGTADALVAAGIVPAGHFPGWPGMRKTAVTLAADGSLTTAMCSNGKGDGTKHIKVVAKGQQIKYQCTIWGPWEVVEPRRLKEQQRRADWECRMNSLPRPAPLIDHPGFRRSEEKTKPAPKYRAEGNVLFLVPRNERRATV